MLVSLTIPFLIYMISPAYFALTEIALWRISSFVLGSILAQWVMEKHKMTGPAVFGSGRHYYCICAAAFALNHTIGIQGSISFDIFAIGTCGMSLHWSYIENF